MVPMTPQGGRLPEVQAQAPVPVPVQPEGEDRSS